MLRRAHPRTKCRARQPMTWQYQRAAADLQITLLESNSHDQLSQQGQPFLWLFVCCLLCYCLSLAMERQYFLIRFYGVIMQNSETPCPSCCDEVLSTPYRSLRLNLHPQYKYSLQWHRLVLKYNEARSTCPSLKDP